ncbi:MAG: hemolysin family protein [Flavobacteriaceae bacterium]|nr:hemolysin family protein [Flavobacteriaceae bacterium]
MTLLLIYLFLAIGISFLCSIAEAVLLTVSMPFIKTKEREGKKTATHLKKLKTDIDRPLSAILSLNTIAHTIGAAGVGAQAVAIFGNAYFGIISAILTILILVFSEILPKTIGAIYWRELALPITKLISFLIIITYPLVILSEFLTQIISKNKRVHTVSREEISALTHIGTEEGIFDEQEGKIIHNLMKLKSIKIKDVMTPRTVVLAASEEMTLHEFFANKEFLVYSRIPIFAHQKDHVTGYILKYDVLEKLAMDEGHLKLKDVKRSILVCYENFSLPKLFDLLISQKEHIALIVDEYGGMEGIATMEDIIETILGLEITDEKDDQIDLQALAREKWKIRAKKMNINLEEDPKKPHFTD